MTIKKWIDFNEKFYSGNFKSKIGDLLKREVGGRPFFNSLDKLIKEDPDVLREITKDLENEYLVASGDFGDNLFNLWENKGIKCKGVLVFNGKIVTKKKGINYYYPEDFDIDNKEFIFVDDSYFSGRTFREVEKYLSEEHKSSIKEIRVGYDGSKEKDPKIKSLYRYYENI